MTGIQIIPPDSSEDIADLTDEVATKQDTSEKNQPNGYAGLDGSSKLSTSQFPLISITDVQEVGSQAAQLALTAQEGDVAVRSDENKSYVHNGGSTGTMADWTLLRTPTDTVLSVNGQTGAVSLVAADVGAQPSDADLTAIAALSTTSYGRALLELADAAAGRTALGAAPTSHGHAQEDVTNLAADLAAKAPLASPAFTGNPTAPTPAGADDDTSIATTEWVNDAIAAGGAAPPTYETALPGSPFDGQEVYYAADAANGIIWHLRYRSAASGSYKWEFLGGPPLLHEVPVDISGVESTASTSYGNLSTSGPNLTTPLAGDYYVDIGAVITAGTSGTGYMSYAIGGTGAVDADAIVADRSAGGNGVSVMKRRLKTGLAASTALSAKYKYAAGSPGYFWDRWMALTPKRVG